METSVVACSDGTEIGKRWIWEENVIGCGVGTLFRDLDCRIEGFTDGTFDSNTVGCGVEYSWLRC